MTTTLIEKGIGSHTELRVKFEPRDVWVGVYWNMAQSVESAYKRLDLFICIVPLLPVHLRFEWGWK
jgi:hypothetical protein